MSGKYQVQSGGIGVFGLLGVAFIVLKLAGLGVVATWPWWIVLMPFWLPLATVLTIIVGGFLIGLTGMAIYSLYESWKKR